LTEILVLLDISDIHEKIVNLKVLEK